MNNKLPPNFSILHSSPVFKPLLVSTNKKLVFWSKKSKSWVEQVTSRDGFDVITRRLKIDLLNLYRNWIIILCFDKAKDWIKPSL